eukprot:9807582-Ditylum_brightwellii.AAC.1
MSEHAENPAKAHKDKVPINGPIHVMCKTTCNVMASSTEAELGALFINTKKGEESRMVLEEMGH